MAVAELVKIPGDLLSPLQTVTLGTTGTTFTVSGLDGNSRLYRLVWRLNGNLVQTDMLFNGAASSDRATALLYNLAGVATVTAAQSAGVCGVGAIITTDLFLKAGAERWALCRSAVHDTGDLYGSESRVGYYTTTGNITSVALTSTSITAGSTCDVYDMGVAR